MSQTYVALDVETTGLDPETDRITEFAAVRFDGDGRELDTFQTLVDPGRAIPLQIQRLTGISDEAVRGAPRLSDIAEEVARFVGAGPVVGQNVGFDMAHLRKAGVQLDVPCLDTAELSRLLLPERQVRRLPDLALALGIEGAEEHHRARGDARLAAAIFVTMHARAAARPPVLRLQLARLVSMQDEALARVIAGSDWDGAGADREPLHLQEPPAPPNLERPAQPAAVSASAIHRALAMGPRAIQGFEERRQQREMALAVGRAFARGGHWMIEAGTGVGKSLAYLLPAALHALNNGERVLVSTNTINLQEQLLTQDVPALRRLLHEAGVITGDEDLRVSVLKGRSNYLCLRRWTASYGSSLADPEFARLAAAMLLWLPRTLTGDRSEINLTGEQRQTWLRFSAQDTDCLARPNSYVRQGSCFLHRARATAESAHIVIVNHALLLADLAAGGSALPPFNHLIVDEAHNLEQQATQQFGAYISMRSLAQTLEGVYRQGRGSREGGVASLLRSFPEGPAHSAGDALAAAADRVVLLAVPFFERLTVLLSGEAEDDRLLVDGALRSGSAWSDLEILWGNLDAGLGRVTAEAASAAEALGGSDLVEEPDVLVGEVQSASRRVEEARLALAGLMDARGDATVVWLAPERDGSASLNSAPLDVGPRLQEELFARKRTVVATSATLSTAGSMSYMAGRLGFEDPETMQLGSPFDYEQATLLAAVTDVPEPGASGWEVAVADSVVELVLAAEGRSLVLFTSHRALRDVCQRARKRLEDAGIAVMAQGLDGSPAQLTEDLRANSRSVIFGTSSFWEGVDLRGEALSLLVLARLPFAVPTDPVHRARSQRYDAPFLQYWLPGAILRFRQGFGRLIRDRSDRGVVAVLDRRIFEKEYGAEFLRSLPRCTRLRGDTPAVASRVREWLA